MASLAGEGIEIPQAAHQVLMLLTHSDACEKDSVGYMLSGMELSAAIFEWILPAGELNISSLFDGLQCALLESSVPYTTILHYRCLAYQELRI